MTESNFSSTAPTVPAASSGALSAFRFGCNHRRFWLAAALIMVVSSALAAPKYWVGASGTTNAPTSGTWQTTAPTVWSDGTVATANVGWTAGDTAYFGGVDGTYSITVGGAISGVGLSFLNSGYTLSAASAQTVSMPSASGFAAPQLRLGAGVAVTIGTNVTVQNSQATGLWIGASDTNASGTLNIRGKVAQNSANTGGIDGYGTVVNVLPGGSLLGPTGASSGGYVVGRNSGADCTVNVNGGTFGIISGNTVAMTIGASGTGTVSVVSGAFTMSKDTGNGIVLGSVAGIPGTLNLNGGITTTPKISMGASGTMSVLNFNGGTLKANANAASFLNNLTTINVRDGGAVIDSGNFGVAIGLGLPHSTFQGDAAIDGGLTKLGTGTLTLTGANTYNGMTTVSNGLLVTTTASSGGGAYTVNDGATLEVQVNTFGTSLTNSSLTLGASGNLTNNFTLGGNGDATIAAVTVNGALNLNGTVKVNVSGSFSGPSTNLLISYGSLTGSGSFSAGTLPPVPGYIGLLVNDTVAKQVKLVYPTPSVPVQWATTSGDWDTTSLNWQPLGGGAMTNYFELSPVTFDDNAPFAATHTVTLTGNRNPTDITVNSANTYLFTGDFAIGAGGTLTKSGNGTLIMGVNSGHSGGTIINGGVVQVGNGGTNGSVGTGDISDYGALVFNRSDAFAVPGIISGSGGVTNNGTGAVSLLATNSYSGPTVVNTGKLAVLSTSTGGGDYQVADGATLEIRSSGTSSYLSANNLTFGTTGGATNNFVLQAGRSVSVPLVYATGNLNLNGSVTVNVSGSGLSAGTYILLQYSGSVLGTGQFVAGGLPGVCTLTNDTSAQQLKLIVTTPGLVWDSGNTNNGSIIDPASGTWDLSDTNQVWNNGAANVAFSNGNGAIFAGADGAYSIKLGSSVSSSVLTFVNSGYVLTNDTPQTVTLANVSTTSPKLVVAAGKTATIGTNVTISSPNTTYFGNTGDTPGGTIIVENGGLLVQTTANTYALDGAGTIASIKTGGIMRLQAGSTSGQIAIGVNNTGNSPILSVDGGLVEILGNGGSLNIGNGSGSAAGTLTLNSGNVTMPIGTTKALTLGVNAANQGTVNLNGGVLTVAKVTKGNSSALATNNFNGGTLKAVNASYASSFLNGLDAANVRDGGAVIDDGGFAITIDQQLQHSAITGDNAIDGGLVKQGTGSLTLTSANTYNGMTTVSNGTLLVNGSILADATVAPGGTLGGIGNSGGSVNVAAGGTLAPGIGGTEIFTVEGNLELQGNAQFVVNESTSPSNSFCVVNGTLINHGTGTIIITNVGPALQLGDSFKLFSQPIVNGGALTIGPAPGAGLAWTNKLAFDGSVAVVVAPSIASYPTNITYTVSTNKLILSWPATHQGWIAQSNSVALADTNFWFDIPGSDSVLSLTNSIDASMNNVFYRLRHP